MPPRRLRHLRCAGESRETGSGRSAWAGTKTLQDLFVDRKVPRADRDRTPVVVDAAGRIVWVVGLALAEAAAALDGADDVVVLSVKRPESPGPEAA